MSCVLEILSLHELNTRKEHLLKQINKIDTEIQKRNTYGNKINVQEDVSTAFRENLFEEESNSEFMEESLLNDNLQDLVSICHDTHMTNMIPSSSIIHEPPKSLRIKLNITRNTRGKSQKQDNTSLDNLPNLHENCLKMDLVESENVVSVDLQKEPIIRKKINIKIKGKLSKE
jgi:hypothetical protein